MHFRLILQPVMALMFAARAGFRDAKAGKRPYFWSLFTSDSNKRKLMVDGWKDVGKVFVIAVILDCVYQIITVQWIYPVETLVVAVMLAFVPYLLFRGAFNRLVSRFGSGMKTS
jgi:hypothetical protein